MTALTVTFIIKQALNLPLLFDNIILCILSFSVILHQIKQSNAFS